MSLSNEPPNERPPVSAPGRANRDGVGANKRPDSEYLLVHDLDRPNGIADLGAVRAQDFLTAGIPLNPEVTVVNVCKSYDYLSNGYYVSLLADARGLKVVPSLDQIEDLLHPYAYLRALREAGIKTIDFTVVRGRRRVMPKVMVPGKRPGRATTEPAARLGEDPESHALRYETADVPYVEVLCAFGRTLDPRFRKVCAQVYRVLGFPLLKIRMYREDDSWKVGQVGPTPIGYLTPEEKALFIETFSSLDDVSNPIPRGPARSSIACLWDPNDPFAASDEEAIRAFARAAKRHGVLFEVIGPRSLHSLLEHDALFIRTVTAVDHISFRFSQTAESLGMPVIDDPQSIVRCSNKIYLHELCERHGIPMLPAMIVSRKTPAEELHAMGFPVVLKAPDGSFSAAVRRAETPQELETLLASMRAKSPLLLAQPFSPTEFDWRIGVLEGRLLYACKYHMARGHWQVAQYNAKGGSRSGRVECVPIDSIPVRVRDIALESSALIGNGFYGVDIKEYADGPKLIEINDNPSIEYGYEDQIEGDRLYDAIIDTFVARIYAAGRASRSDA
jgi:glutathione synthase/RimK-type ligase-like ATP-grasp enzyme